MASKRQEDRSESEMDSEEEVNEVSEDDSNGEDSEDGDDDDDDDDDENEGGNADEGEASGSEKKPIASNKTETRASLLGEGVKKMAFTEIETDDGGIVLYPGTKAEWESLQPVQRDGSLIYLLWTKKATT